MGWFSDKKPGGNDILTQGDEALAVFEGQYQAFAREKEQKMQRQVELWSIMSPSEDLKKEYKEVAADVAFLVKKMLCMEEYLKELKLARFHAGNGSSDRLKKALTVPDPCANVTREIPKIEF